MTNKKPHGIQMNSVVRALTLLDVLKENTDRETMENDEFFGYCV